MDFFEGLLQSDGLLALRAARPAWKQVREYRAEYALLEIAQPLQLASKSEMKALQAMLNKRNQCAHPTSFVADLTPTLGLMAEVLHHLDLLSGKQPIAPPTSAQKAN